MIPIIACTGHNLKFTKIALANGFEYGCRLPTQVVSKLYFADQDWKLPNRQAYTTAIMTYRPKMATVLDLERENQYWEVMDWADEVSQWVEQVLIIPKVSGIINRIPRTLNGKQVVLAYSVPTEYGGTFVDINEFAEWPIHLLGGSPFDQLRYLTLFKEIAEINSIDHNYAQKMATQYCQFFIHRPQQRYNNRNWPTLEEYDGVRWNGEGPVEAYRRSCIAMKQYWEEYLNY